MENCDELSGGEVMGGSGSGSGELTPDMIANMGDTHTHTKLTFLRLRFTPQIPCICTTKT